MTGALWFLGVVIVQRLGELVLARRNTSRLMARGAVEHGAGHYPVMVAMHSAWIAAMVVFGWDNPVLLPLLAIFFLLQVLRLWILASLGDRWTTRIIVLDAPLVARGPFRFMPHPNYALVVAEIIVAPVVLELWIVAIVFTLLNAAMLRHRITVENRALSPLREAQGNSSGV